MHITYSGTCRSGAPKQTLEPALQDCLAFARETKNIWPKGVTYHDKLWRTAKPWRTLSCFWPMSEFIVLIYRLIITGLVILWETKNREKTWNTEGKYYENTINKYIKNKKKHHWILIGWEVCLQQQKCKQHKTKPDCVVICFFVCLLMKVCHNITGWILVKLTLKIHALSFIYTALL